MNHGPKKFKITILIISALICYTFIYISVRHSITKHRIQSLQSLDGQTITLNELHKKIPKGLSELNKNKEIAFFTEFMNINIPENSILYHVNGKGIPNYYGVIIYDTVKNNVKKIYLRELK